MPKSRLSLAAALLRLTPLVRAADSPVPPSYVPRGVVGIPLAVVPKMQITFRSTAVDKDLASKRVATDGTDPADARGAAESVFYQLGLDIATRIFGNPQLCAPCYTLMDPGSEKMRGTHSATGQRGFNASLSFHLARSYR